MELRISGTVQDSIVDGPGLRYVVFVQGCPHGCEGCHNPQTHDFAGGRLCDTQALFEEFAENPLTQGVTFSGGEPFCQPQALYELAKKIKVYKPLNLICYSGWTFEELIEKAKREKYTKKLLEITDILVDGKFVLAQRSLSLSFRGSTNQRIIDVQKSLSAGNAVETEI